MNPQSRGVKNAFRNPVRTLSITLILGLAIGLCLVMLVAYQAVNKKINDVKSSVGNTITIQPAGFNSLSQANNALSTSQLDKVKNSSHITSLTESLTDRLTTTGSSQPSFGIGNNDNSNSNNQTSLSSPVTINTNGGGRFFVNGGGSLPTNFSPPITIVGSTDTSHIQSTTLTITSGKNIDGSADSSNALISEAMASKNNLKVGSTFTAYGTDLTVAGIYKTTTGSADNTVVVALPTLQRLTNQSGDVTSATATVDSADNLASSTNTVKSLLGSSADVTNAQDQADNTVKPLENVKTISLVSLIGAVIAGGVIIFLVMLMVVRERRREIGILKAIGATNYKVIWQFVVEAVTLTMAAAAIGIVIGVAAASPVTNTLVNNAASSSTSTVSQTRGGGGNFAGPGLGSPSGSSGPSFTARGRGLGAVSSNITNIHTAVGWSIIIYGLLAAAAIAVIGSSLSSFLIAKVRPAEVMRTE
jgi:putative ABC transport system permease protein